LQKLTLECYKAKCVCKNCENKGICNNINPLARNEYAIKPVKYAVLKIIENIGIPNNDNKL